MLMSRTWAIRQLCHTSSLRFFTRACAMVSIPEETYCKNHFAHRVGSAGHFYSTQSSQIELSALLGTEAIENIRKDNVTASAIKKFRAWSLENTNKPIEIQTSSLDAVIDEVCSDRTIGYEDYKTGHLYTQILDMVLEVANNESVKSSMLRYLKHQPFISLGKISLYAAQQNLPWLEESVKDQIYSQLSSLSTGHEILFAFNFLKFGLISKEGSLLLESRTKGCVENIPSKTIINILHLMAIMLYRSTDLIKALIYQLSKRPTVITIQQLSNLYYSYSTLKIVYPRALSCLEILSSTVLHDKTPIDEKFLLRIMLSIGKLKWDNPTVINAVCSRIVDPSQLPVESFTSLLVTCSITGTMPANVKAAVIHQLKVAGADPKHCQSYLKQIWSLLVFNIKSESIIKDLLTEDRIAHLTSADLSQHTVIDLYGKLLNVAAAAKLEYNLEFPETLKTVSVKPPINLSKHHVELSRMLCECLECNSAQIQQSVWYPTGNAIDFRYLYDTKEKKVVSPHKYILPLDVEDLSEKTKTPEHMKWVAVLVNTFDHQTVGVSAGKTLDGRKRLAESQLSQMGYHVVNIGEAEFSSDPDRARKLEWLKEKLSVEISHI